MVYRVYVEKIEGQTHEATALFRDLTTLLEMKNLTGLRLFQRYDVEDISASLWEQSLDTVFSEPQVDTISYDLPKADRIFAVEYLPGQFDQRADSACQCLRLIDPSSEPIIRTARVYALYGNLTDADEERIRHYVVNPVEARIASLAPVETLKVEYDVPEMVKTVEGFLDMDMDALAECSKTWGLAMDLDDLKFCQDYFKTEHRDPTLTEIRMIDTYWSDHCRHTTFLTHIDSVSFEDPMLEQAFERYKASRKALGREEKPMTLMDVATLAARQLKADGKLPKLDESEEINACTVKMTVETENGPEPWLLLFKNETHNHPTEIEPFGGAATCIGGAIRDPLSGRSYVYAAMRVTGAANPLRPISETMEGKLPQRKLVTTAAAGYSSYGNQIGLATSQVDELYHEGYAAKRLEIGAVLGAAPQENVVRLQPAPGDVIVLLGGRTGRDGCGGATGSSKSHTLESLESCGAEVQKGNAPEERKLQRLFRNPEATRIIKRCNDFGAGGVSVAVGELADGLLINLDRVPKKYEGLDGTELAISESQERMAVVLDPKDLDTFLKLADTENLEATVVATVQADPRLQMTWRDTMIVDLSREFLNSNGAEKHTDMHLLKPESYEKETPACFACGMESLVGDLNVCSKQGLSERFDSTIGAGTVIMPFGGREQRTPSQAMVHTIPVRYGYTPTCSYMAWGYNPMITEKSPYHGAYLAVIESVAKLAAAGASMEDTYLTFQEYFEKPKNDPRRFGKPLSALLGAFSAQLDLGMGSIGGKDSMSGSFEDLDVPPTLVSFAVTTGHVSEVCTPEFKKAGHPVIWLRPETDTNGLPKTDSFLKLAAKVHEVVKSGRCVAAYTPTYGGVAEAIFKQAIGNNIGFAYDQKISLKEIFGYAYGSFILELTEPCDCGTLLGYTTEAPTLTFGDKTLNLSDLLTVYEGKLEPVYTKDAKANSALKTFSAPATAWAKPKTGVAKPLALLPVFPGTNCEYDTARAIEAAGGKTQIFVLNTLTEEGINRSVDAFAEAMKQAQMIVLPGGFSGGDEPDGSGKFITAFFRNPKIAEQVAEHLNNRDGLMCGICNGFQALIKLGLVPYGEIRTATAESPTLTFNTIARHQSRIVRTRVASNRSPWLMETNVGDVFTVPISHGEGRFFASDAVIAQLAENGQIATQYADFDGNPSMDILHNPNGSAFAIEGITSPDGRVLGKMGHSERIGPNLYKNVEGNYDMGIFRSAVKYFK